MNHLTKELGRLVIKFEEWQVSEEETPTLMVSVYKDSLNNVGAYVGSFDKNTLYLIQEKGIMPELADKNNNVCSIGKSFRDGKWYGWSHRAIHGFQIGDVVKEGDCCASSGLTDEYLKDHPEENKALPVGFVAKTEKDCKRMAIAFADSVG